MTKKDLIIVAVLFNIVVFAGVLATARQLSIPAKPIERENKPTPLVIEEPESVDTACVEEGNGVAFDEIDQLLEEYISEGPAITEPKEREMAAPKIHGQNEKSNKDADGMFYVVQAGDNPWKIAKKFHLSFEKLLQLNHLDEAKARNLKIGQRLRIREKP